MNSIDQGEKVARGTIRMARIIDGLRPLAEYLAGNHLNTRICLPAADYAFIRRWRRAAAASDFVIEPDAVHWRQFELYPKAHTDMRAEQTEIA